MEAVLQLERSWARWAGVSNVVACSSGSAALHLALESLCLPSGSGIIIPDLTIVACARAATLASLVPIFVDVTPNTLLLDPDKVDEACSLSDVPISAIMPVHLYGRRAAMDEIAVLADKYDLAVVEDAAEAHGVPIHPQTDAACWSTFRNKVVNSQEGGLVAFRNSIHAYRARQLRCLGFTPEHDYRHLPRGMNYRLANVLAELALESLAEAEVNLERRREIEGWYDRHCPEKWRLPRSDSVWVYCLRIPGLTRERQGEIVHRLQSAGIAARFGFYPLSQQEEYRGVLRGRWRNENAVRAANEVFYLPVSPGETTEEAARRAFEVIHSCLDCVGTSGCGVPLMRTYDDTLYCDHCNAWTRQRVVGAEHERDGSGDSRTCLECGWCWSGLTGEW